MDFQKVYEAAIVTRNGKRVKLSKRDENFLDALREFKAAYDKAAELDDYGVLQSKHYYDFDGLVENFFLYKGTNDE